MKNFSFKYLMNGGGRLIISILILLTNLRAISQSVSIICDPSSPVCNYVDPETNISYQANIINAPSGYTPYYNWLPNINGTLVSSSSAVTGIIKWLNLSSQYGKTLNLDIVFKKTGATNITVHATSLSITVKYLSPFTSFNIPGASNPNPTNNSSVNVSCGVQSFTLTANTLTTDPTSAVIYYWSYPSGWSGPSSTSTSSSSVTTNAGGGGTIQLSAVRSDGAFLQKYIVQVNRPTVGSVTLTPTSSITGSGSNPLCNSEVATYSANGANASNYTWSATSGISFIGGTNNQTASFTAVGTNTLTVTATNSCALTSSNNAIIYQGTPTITTPTVNGSASQTINNITVNPAFLASISPSASQWNWSLACGTAGCGTSYIQQIGQNCNAYAKPFITVQSQVQNRCGIGTSYFYYVYNNAFSGFRVTSGNPTTSTTLSMTINDYALIKDQLEGIYLSSDQVFGLRKSKPINIKDGMVQWDISNLKKGTYYVTLLDLHGNKNSKSILIM